MGLAGGGRATGALVVGGEICTFSREGWLLLAADVGTCWKALVTSWIDILEGAEGKEGEGVVPSLDFTSGSTKGSGVRSSAIPFNEFTGLASVLLDGWDHTALRCSGSGARDGDSFIGKLREDLVHGD